MNIEQIKEYSLYVIGGKKRKDGDKKNSKPIKYIESDWSLFQ